MPNYNDISLQFLEKYDAWIESRDLSYRRDREHNNKLLDKFLEQFPLNKIINLEIDEYVVGKGARSFCWWVETELAAHGDIRPHNLTSFQKFGLDYDKVAHKYRFGGKKVKKTRFGSNYVEIYSNIRTALVNLIQASISHDYETIARCPLNELFKNKITYLYNRNDYLPIYSDGDLNVVLSLLEIPFSLTENRIYKRKRLFDFYKQLGRDDISTLDFMRYIYNEAGFRPYLRSDTNIKLKDAVEAKRYVLVDVGRTTEINRARRQTGGGLVSETPETLQSKKMSGKKGEEIVKEYLKLHREELGIIGEIDCPCEYNDSAHYDFSYNTSSGKIYIEVKATRTNRNNVVNFEMSDDEFDFMNDNADSYYIFYINDVFEGNVILRIPSHLILTKPSKYKASFSIE